MGVSEPFHWVLYIGFPLKFLFEERILGLKQVGNTVIGLT